MTDTTPKPARVAGLATDIEAEAAVLQRELGEVELLLGQVRTEAQRHETRRQQTAERFDAQLAGTKATTDLKEAHEQLVLQARRAALMEAQLEVLEGKQKVLRRFADYLDRMLSGMGASRSAGGATLDGGVAAGNGSAGIEMASRSVLAAQEEMRRQIARQMHDGPAQSIANIALQAEVVQRLLRQDAAAGERELDALREMVEHALEETKAFIFDVRPMVLDDLGLMPTLRRAAQDRTRRTGRRIRFESLGADRRLGPDQESALFRIVDDAVTGYLEALPDEIAMRLNWTDDEVIASVVSEEPPVARAAAAKDEARPARGGAPVPAGALPPALAAMIDEQRDREHLRSSPGLSPLVVAAIRSRANAAGITIELSEDGRMLSAICRAADR
jgi:two-component system, NarL family, sensor histidine kinase DegS